MCVGEGEGGELLLRSSRAGSERQNSKQYECDFQLPEKDFSSLPSKRTHGETSEGKGSVDISDVDLGSAKVENAQQVCGYKP